MKIIERESHFFHCCLMVTSVLVVLAMVLSATRPAVAQFGHSDIDFGLDSGQLITNKRVYDSFFPAFGISKQFTANPGFAAETDGMGTIRPRVDVFYDVLDDLLLWDGDRFVFPDDQVRIRIDNNPPGSNSTYVDAMSGVQFGSPSPLANRIGKSSDSGEVHSHVNFFLEGDDDDLPIGAYGLKLAISTDSEEIVDSEPVFVVFNFGLDSSVFDEGLGIYESLLDTSSIAGDFDGNGTLDARDIDLLTEAVLQNSTDSQFDLNTDASVDKNDRRYWVTVLRETYFGDSNLDGEFNSEDIVGVFQAGEYEDLIEGNSVWSTGDWNGDTEFTNEDIVVAFIDGGYERGPRAMAVVPEPNGMLLVLVGATLVMAIRKKK